VRKNVVQQPSNAQQEGKTMSTRSDEAGKSISRRSFLRSGAAGLGAALVSAKFSRVAGEEEDSPAQKQPSLIETRTLGRTNLSVTVVGFGSYGFSNPGVLQKAIESGINLVLTDRTYGNGQAEKAIGQVLAKVSRDKLVVGTGWGVSPGVTKAQLLAGLDASLQRLQTDRIDLLRAFMVGDPKVIAIDEQYEALEAAKKAGKARFYGLSAHGGNQLEVFDAAIESGKFDFVMGRYNFMEHEQSETFVKKLAEKKIGFIGFKISAGKRKAEIEQLSKPGLSLHAASTKWALQNPCVTSILGSMTSFEAVQEYLGAMGSKLSSDEKRMLHRYSTLFDSEYCRNCGTCQIHCPYGVAVADVMRYGMYFKYYGTETEAVRLYAALPPQARALPCAGCKGYCTPFCPHGLAVRDNLLEVNRLLA
jgi:predicted aldo/keto reductase-like oxidoreductase